jgi:hypothetical protein
LASALAGGVAIVGTGTRFRGCSVRASGIGDARPALVGATRDAAGRADTNGGCGLTRCRRMGVDLGDSAAAWSTTAGCSCAAGTIAETTGSAATTLSGRSSPPSTAYLSHGVPRTLLLEIRRSTPLGARAFLRVLARLHVRTAEVPRSGRTQTMALSLGLTLSLSTTRMDGGWARCLRQTCVPLSPSSARWSSRRLESHGSKPSRWPGRSWSALHSTMPGGECRGPRRRPWLLVSLAVRGHMLGSVPDLLVDLRDLRDRAYAHRRLSPLSGAVRRGISTRGFLPGFGVLGRATRLCCNG